MAYISRNSVQYESYYIFTYIFQFEEKTITITMEDGDFRFGFSVIGGFNEGFPARIDNIATGKKWS